MQQIIFVPAHFVRAPTALFKSYLLKITQVRERKRKVWLTNGRTVRKLYASRPLFFIYRLKTIVTFKVTVTLTFDQVTSKSIEVIYSSWPSFLSRFSNIGLGVL